MADDSYVVRDDLLKLPDIKLDDQDVKTGEEDETVMWSQYVRLIFEALEVISSDKCGII